MLRRLAQNREAARKSRLRKKVNGARILTSCQPVVILPKIEQSSSIASVKIKSKINCCVPALEQAYIQQLETSRIKLAQLEQELQRTRQQQGVYPPGHSGMAGFGGVGGVPMDSGVAAFEIEYGHWVDEQNRHTRELRGALQPGQQTTELELRMLVETGLGNYDHLFRIKNLAASADVFCVMYGLWRSPAERFFLWIGGFRPSEVLKVL